jgi:uncharacterized SAM-binding protein YcdF (DUF218 family)
LSKLPTKKQIQKKKLILSVSALVSVFAIVAFYLIMTKSGHWLVQDDEFDHVDWVVVLDGETADMERTDLAAELMASGKTDSVLILGRRILRTRSNAEFYLEEFLRQGNFDSNAVFIVRHDDPSSIGEANTIIPWLKNRNADTVLLLTSAASTFRVKNIFETLSGDEIVYLTQNNHHHQYNADSWYSSREGRKEWLRGWAALFASYIDLFSARVLTEADSCYYKPIISAKEYEAEKNPVVDLQSLLPKVEEKLGAPDTVKADSLKADTLQVDTAKVDTTSKK